MSNFSALTFHPVTNIIEMANWMDDHFEKHHYGVYFSSDGVTYDPFKNDCERVYPKAANRIAALEAECNHLRNQHERDARILWERDELQRVNDELAAALREVAEAHFDLSLHKQHDTLSHLKHNAQKALAKLDGADDKP